MALSYNLSWYMPSFLDLYIDTNWWCLNLVDVSVSSTDTEPFLYSWRIFIIGPIQGTFKDPCCPFIDVSLQLAYTGGLQIHKYTGWSPFFTASGLSWGYSLLILTLHTYRSKEGLVVFVKNTHLSDLIYRWDCRRHHIEVASCSFSLHCCWRNTC